MRIVPRTNDAVNEEWISDKTRFIWDGLRTQRLDRPYVRDNGTPVSYTHLRAHETVLDLVCRLLLEKKKHTKLDKQ